MTVHVLVRNKGERRDLLLYYVHPLTRREVSKTSGTRDRREAERAAGLWEAELAEHFGTGNDGWQHFRDRVREEYLAVLSDKSFDSYTTALNHFERLMAPQAVSNIDASAIGQFQSRLLGEGYKLPTIATYMTHLRAILNWAEEIGMLRKAPRIKMPRIPKRSFMRGRPITEAEYRKMLTACKCLRHPPAWRRFLEMLWLSGLRLGEALIVSWDQPPVMVSLNAKPYPQLLFYAEGQKARRDEAIPIAPDFADWLKATAPADRHGRIAPLPLKSEERVSEYISSIGRHAGVIVNSDDKPASAQDLRRGFGTRWAPHVMPLTLQKLMRHSDISTTMKYYVNLSSADAGRELWLVPNDVPKNGSARRMANGTRSRNSRKTAANRPRKR